MLKESENPYQLGPLLLKRFEQFRKIDDATKRFQRIIELGKKLPELDRSKKIESNQVKGCASLTYITGHLKEDGKMEYEGDSNSLLVKGLLALLIEGFRDEKPQDIIKTDPAFMEAMGLSQALTASRASGFINTYNMMITIALKEEKNSKG
jgi:sulfur transfer protein SufE